MAMITYAGHTARAIAWIEKEANVGTDHTFFVLGSPGVLEKDTEREGFWINPDKEGPDIASKRDPGYIPVESEEDDIYFNDEYYTVNAEGKAVKKERIGIAPEWYVRCVTMDLVIPIDMVPAGREEDFEPVWYRNQKFGKVPVGSVTDLDRYKEAYDCKCRWVLCSGAILFDADIPDNKTIIYKKIGLATGVEILGEGGADIYYASDSAVKATNSHIEVVANDTLQIHSTNKMEKISILLEF